jgi:exodeoxyribonuclease V beta subunit
MSEPLAALSLPLWGSRLIEASAGTGKTWTIAALYLRLVLGHGADGAAFPRPLAPSEVLVLTFTRAATRELSDRIRSRLLEAARCFRGDAPPGDPLLADLLAEYPEGPARAAAAWRLAAAAEGMDDAAVFTIDAWCQRMLREHAFDSGSLFDEELVPDDSTLRDEAVRDYWRQHLYPLSAVQLEVVLSVWKDVDALGADVRNLLRHPQGGAPAAEPLGALVDRLSAAFVAQKGDWPARVAIMRDWLQAQCDLKHVDGKRLRPSWFNPWLDALAQWAGTPDALRAAVKKGAERLTPEGLREVWKGPEPLDLPAEFEAFGELMALPGWSPAIRLHAAAQVGQRLQWLKRQSGQFGFDDMLDRLDVALAGPNGARLRERIATQYPVALIDEFQDTSPVQYRLFDRLYRTAANDPATALLLIGDPKQSIYGFRGADIHSYLLARRATEGRHYVLDTNHRSTGGLVAAVNHLFELAEGRDGPGAFLLRARGDHPLPFLPVKARGREEHLRTMEGPVPAVTLCLDGELLDGKTSQRRFAAASAERVVTWLNDPEAGFDGGSEGFVRLRPADIAVLVRTGQEAEAVRRELRRRGVSSVFLSDRHSVFASPEAADLLRWLRAVAEPLDAHLVRAALATVTMARSLDELATLADDDTVFDQRTEDLRELHRTWLGQGVLTMLRQTLHVLSLPSRWLALPDGERRLTNYLHLAELLQAASTHLDNEHALVRWLAERIADGADGADEQIVRLESDADLVKVITVHKSKGLEYPVVLLPFATAVRSARPRGPAAVSVMGANGERELHLEPSDEVVALAERERLQEDLRLLYVALTRARHALWVGVAALQQDKVCVAHRSAFGYLAAGGSPVTEDGLVAAVDALASGHGEVLAEPVNPAPARTPLRRHDQDVPLVTPVPYAARFERRWSVGSFSSMVRHIAHAPMPPLAGVVREDEVLASADGNTTVPAAATQPWHTFPRGALPGNFLHDQLEWLAEEQFGLAASERLQDRLRKRCDRQGWGHRADDVVAWLGDVVSRPLPPVGAALDTLAGRLPEMEFWFPSEALATGEVDRLCRVHLLGGIARPELPERELRGMLMGFADLVFFHGGKYWVLDYKSNALGTRDADYTRGALEASMAEHRYDVQAALYLLALHRLLKIRLGAGYDPAEHLGGAVYLFLRGIHGPASGCCHVPAHPDFLDALDEAFGTLAEGVR